jgi:hypothetical protein
MTTIESATHLSDGDLLSEVTRAVTDEHAATAHLIALLAEVDVRRLYLGQGYSSLFTYCTQALHLSEHAAYGRIEAARAARRCPMVLDLLADGSLNVTTVGLLARHLTADNHRHVLERARHKSKREVECIVAALWPLPVVPSSVRKLPNPVGPTATPELPARADHHEVVAAPEGSEPCRLFDKPMAPPAPRVPRAAAVTPLAPTRYRLQVTVSAEAHEDLRRAQDLLRHVIANGDLAMVVARALKLLVQQLERTRCAQTSRPRQAHPARSGSRHVPAAVRRAVWARDKGQCAFEGKDGRCRERGFLEIHHVVPYATGGKTVGENLQLRCRAHNAFEAEHFFGPPMVREAPALYSVQTEPGRVEELTCRRAADLDSPSSAEISRAPRFS